MALITKNELQQDRIAEGDCGVILKKDGSFRLFNCYDDLKPGMPMNPRQLEQGKAMAAFALLLTMPEMLDIVAGMATDPAVNGGKAVDTDLAH